MNLSKTVTKPDWVASCGCARIAWREGNDACYISSDGGMVATRIRRIDVPDVIEALQTFFGERQ